jgi:serine acetyltransferase
MSFRTDIRADFIVNRRPLDRMTVTAFRLNQAARRGRLRTVKRIVAKVVDVVWMQGVVGADMPGEVVCGPGLRLPHGGRGIAVHPQAKLGSGVTLYQRVTVGGFGPDKTNVPTVGDNALFYVGSTAVGRITIGSNVTVGAGTVVTKDVPSNTTAVGAKATYIAKTI